MKIYVTESWRDAATAEERHESMRVMRIKLPSQEVILVWVFVKYLHFQLLTRYFMDNHLTHTHTRTHRRIHKNMDIYGQTYYSHTTWKHKDMQTDDTFY